MRLIPFRWVPMATANGSCRHSLAAGRYCQAALTGVETQGCFCRRRDPKEGFANLAGPQWREASQLRPFASTHASRIEIVNCLVNNVEHFLRHTSCCVPLFARIARPARFFGSKQSTRAITQALIGPAP